MSVQFAELIEHLPELRKMAVDSRDAKAKAVALDQAFTLLQRHCPHALFTTAVFNEKLQAEHSAQVLDRDLFTQVTALLIGAPGPVARGPRTTGYKRHPAAYWLDDNSLELPDDQWVAVDGNGLVAADPEQDGLLKKLSDLNLPPANVCIMFNQSLVAAIAAAVD